MFNELEEEFNISSLLDKEEVVLKIIECKCDRKQMDKWIEDKL